MCGVYGLNVLIGEPGPARYQRGGALTPETARRTWARVRQDRRFIHETGGTLSTPRRSGPPAAEPNHKKGLAVPALPKLIKLLLTGW